MTPPAEHATPLEALDSLSHELTLCKDKVIRLVEQCLASNSLAELRANLQPLAQVALLRGKGETIRVQADLWQEQLQQIRLSRSMERAFHYLKRLLRSLDKVKTPQFSDVNLYRWQEYQDLWTDSLWTIDRRDRSGQHSSHYWGNFVPQIPNQLMRRFSKQGEWVLDPFLGSGTTLIEARRLGRNGLGVELQESVAQETWSRVQREDNPHRVESIVRQANSANCDFRHILDQHRIKEVNLAILHPPYHDIIQFSDHPDDLSNQQSVEAFLERFAQVVSGVSKVLQKKRFLAVVIGDKYCGQNWVPLGFQTMQKVQELGLNLKSIIVKNFDGTLGKRNQRELWRYRALAGGFYIFKHEYIFLFQKP